MNRKNLKIISSIILTIILLGNVFNFTYAATNIDEINNNFDKYVETNTSDYPMATHKAGLILGYIQIIGTVLSIIILIILGIKFMLGSVEEKANMKESLKPYIIGVIILFTSTLIPRIIFNAFNK